MKKFINYLKEYLKIQFNLKLYSVTGVFLIITIFCNYYFKYDDNFVDSYYKSPFQILINFMTFGTAYYSTSFFIFLFTENKKFIKNPQFWLVSFIGLITISFYCSFYYHKVIANIDFIPSELYRYTYKVLGNIRGIFICIFPLWIFYKIYDKEEVGHFYGFRSTGVSFKPYWIMLGCMIPLLLTASFFKEFQQTYPFYQKANGHLVAQYFDISEVIPALLFELSYASRFLTVELFFRGFLIMAMVRFLDKDVVLPMVVTYAFLHFGKPMPETVSSIFGGYILGIVALYSKNIWGGVFIHVGIALFMDFFVYLQK